MSSEALRMVGAVSDYALLPETLGELQAEPYAPSSVAKALSLLGVFTAEHQTMGVTELARRANLAKSTAFRLLSILAESGLVERTGTKYSLGPWVLELASLAAESKRQEIRDVALPFLQDLYELTHETVHLAALYGPDVLYIEKIYGHNQVVAPSRVGGRVNAGCTALGKAILAFSGGDAVRQVLAEVRPLTPNTIVVPRLLIGELSRIRQAGVAFDREESAPGVACVAAPIVGWNRNVIAAVSICGSAARFDPQRRVGAVQRAAANISVALTKHRLTNLS